MFSFKRNYLLAPRLIYLFILLISPLSTMAIVNMDGLHFDQKENTSSAALDITASGSSGNQNSTKTSLNGQYNWIKNKVIHLAIVGYQYGENNNISNVNKAFIHYRYIYQMNETLDLEFFGQLEKNEFTRISYRGLVGSGVRYSIAKTNKHRGFLGLGGFYSSEKTEVTEGLTDDGVENFVRANLYFLSKYQISSTLNFSNVIYYQPRLSDFSDYRALLESKLDFKIAKNLSLRLSLDVEHDSQPSQTIKSTDVSYMTGLAFKF